MKKSSTFNLEQDMYDEIEAYRETYNLSSRNIALERMLLERRIMLNMGAMKDIPKNQQTDIEKPKEADILESQKKDVPKKFRTYKDPQTGKEFTMPINTKSIL